MLVSHLFLLRTIVFLLHIAWLSTCSQPFLMKNSQMWVIFASLLPVAIVPGSEVLDIVAGYFTELPLQSHLQILANSIATMDLGDSAREGKGRSPRCRSGAWDGGSPLFFGGRIYIYIYKIYVYIYIYIYYIN